MRTSDPTLRLQAPVRGSPTVGSDAGDLGRGPFARARARLPGVRRSVRLQAQWAEKLGQLEQAVFRLTDPSLELGAVAVWSTQATDKLGRLMPLRDEAIRLEREVSEAREAARAAWIPELGRLVEVVQRWDRAVSVLAEYCLVGQQAYVSMAFSAALEDASGRTADDLVRRVFGCRPVVKRATGPLDRREGLWGFTKAARKDHTRFRLVDATGVRTFVLRFARQTLRHRWIADQDRLELSPKGHSRLQRMESDPGDGDGLPAPKDGDLESLVLLHRELTAAAESPTDRALLVLVARGAKPSEACRELGVSRRVWENLQGRARRRLSH